MPKKTKMSQEDLAAFHEAMKGVKPLSQGKVRLAPKRGGGEKRSSSRGIKQRDVPLPFESLEAPESFLPPPPVGGDQRITYKHNSLSDKMLRKLRKGQYNVEAKLDLHGLSVEEAKTAMDHFLQQCLQRGIRVVLIIHGKGHHSQTPILKNKLNHWLRHLDVVLAFCSAGPSHGSGGATYVLLRHLTEENDFE